jgi:putative tryptophan/tyrosine transport system substrate-binding protein
MRRREFARLLGGVLAARPLSAFAQEKAMPVIGYLSGEGRAPEFYDGLSDTRYDAGQNIAIEYRLAQGDYDQLPALAADLAGRNVGLIAAFGPSAARAAKSATSTIPIVFISQDPVDEGLVASLARPGGNLTGISIITVELMPKRFELLSELVPQARVFALLVNPSASNAEAMIRHTQDAARAKGIELHVLKASSANDEIDAAFATLLQLRAGALVVGADSLLVRRLPYLVALASRHAVPAMYVSSEFAWAGGLISYGPSLKAAYRQFGIYAGRILNGAKPADLPIQQPTKFELVINLKTAQALGLAVPPALLARADEIIE